MKNLVLGIFYVFVGVAIGGLLVLFYLPANHQRSDRILDNGTYVGTQWSKVNVHNTEVKVTNSNGKENTYFYADINKDTIVLVNEKMNYANKFKVKKNGKKYTLYTIKGTVTAKQSDNVLNKDK